MVIIFRRGCFVVKMVNIFYNFFFFSSKQNRLKIIVKGEEHWYYSYYIAIVLLTMDEGLLSFPEYMSVNCSKYSCEMTN